MNGCIEEENRTDCKQGIRVSFYSKSSCLTDTVYPNWSSNMILCVFDQSNTLTTYITKENVELSKNYMEELLITSGSGVYTVTTWFGINTSTYDINDLKPGITKKDDILFRLKRTQESAYSLEGEQVYFGESPAFYINSKEYTVQNTTVNLQEISNRLTVSIEGINSDPEEYEIYIESSSSSMNLDGTIAQDILLRYDSEKRTSTSMQVIDEFTLLKLETGYTYTLVIKNKKNEQELYRESLLGTLLLKNPYVNLDCDHDFTIQFTAKDLCECGTYTIMEIWVNNWLVHSYNTGF